MNEDAAPRVRRGWRYGELDRFDRITGPHKGLSGGTPVDVRDGWSWATCSTGGHQPPGDDACPCGMYWLESLPALTSWLQGFLARVHQSARTGTMFGQRLDPHTVAALQAMVRHGAGVTVAYQAELRRPFTGPATAGVQPPAGHDWLNLERRAAAARPAGRVYVRGDTRPRHGRVPMARVNRGGPPLQVIQCRHEDLAGWLAEIAEHEAQHEAEHRTGA